MNKLTIFIFITLVHSYCFAFTTNKDSVSVYTIADTAKATGFYTQLNVQFGDAKKVQAGIGNSIVQLSLNKNKKQSSIVMQFPSNGVVVANGIDVIANKKKQLSLKYNWQPNTNYQLLIQTASDSVENFTIYSGYIFLPEVQKWKLLGSCKINRQWGYVNTIKTFQTKNKATANFANVSAQRNNGSWKNLSAAPSISPITNLLSHADSVAQLKLEQSLIKQAIAKGKTDAVHEQEGIYYTILKEGNGKAVNVEDTVEVYYKGYLFNNETAVFDQTKDKTAKFPLSRLIKGWGIGVPQCTVGGKIKLIIPSALGYSIRTRSPKIPPNSILVFEIEIIDAK
jgi:FKBP-type peptidyl-prolyl cis-trans isomerase FkpA